MGDAATLKKARGTMKGTLTKCILKMQRLVVEDAPYDEVIATLERMKTLFIRRGHRDIGTNEDTLQGI